MTHEMFLCPICRMPRLNPNTNLELNILMCQKICANGSNTICECIHSIIKAFMIFLYSIVETKARWQMTKTENDYLSGYLVICTLHTWTFAIAHLRLRHI